MKPPLLAGPVLLPSEVGLAILSAIRASNVGVQVEDRGAYLRVSAHARCVVTRQAIEQALGRPVKLPSDLEQCMPSFRGRLQVDHEHVSWEARSA
ncbi:MAG TPA: MmoB/DmpM family protein [Polyangiaceae bacterium]|nr:MmoB/DmpM family protein [Polyangiaceae bacterium]